MESGFWSAVSRYLGEDVILLKLGVVATLTTAAWYFLDAHPLAAIGPAMVATYGTSVAYKALMRRRNRASHAADNPSGPHGWMGR